MKRVAIITKDGVEFKQIPKNELLKHLQDYVGGHIEYIPHYDGKYVAYANEDKKNLFVNELATKTLAEFGFINFQQQWGNVVMMGEDEKSLSKKQEIFIKKIVNDLKNNK